MTTLGKYELHKIIGKGGFGTVYYATDLALGRVVALKVLHPQWAVDPTFIERFQREARLLASLEHPNIVWVSDVGEEQGRYYLVERYLPGGSLADRLAKGRLPVDEVPGILRQVCAGLQELHQRGWVHRDLKPANIMFDAVGQAVITDFGLARAMAASSGSSSSSTGGAGTPFYRAPELWRGKPPVSPATDVYSLGCILGEMLTGKPLFAGDTPDEIITRHLIDGPDLGETWPPEGVPFAMVQVVAKALQRDPAQRYPDAQAFAQALEGSPEYGQVQEGAEQDLKAAVFRNPLIFDAIVIDPDGTFISGDAAVEQKKDTSVPESDQVPIIYQTELVRRGHHDAPVGKVEPLYTRQIPEVPVPTRRKKFLVPLIIAIIGLIIGCCIVLMIIDNTRSWCDVAGWLFNARDPGSCP